MDKWNFYLHVCLVESNFGGEQHQICGVGVFHFGELGLEGVPLLRADLDHAAALRRQIWR